MAVPANLVYNHVLGTRSEAALPRAARRLILGRTLPGGVRVPLDGQLRRTIAHRRANRRGQELDVNLAVGWLGAAAPSNALGGGHGFVGAARPGVNGDLCAMVAGRMLSVVGELQNVPLELVACCGKRGALLAVAQPGCGPGPGGGLRAVAIDTQASPSHLWPGLHQAVSGQIAWTVDTRCYGLEVSRVDSLDAMVRRRRGRRSPRRRRCARRGPRQPRRPVVAHGRAAAARRRWLGRAGQDGVALLEVGVPSASCMHGRPPADRVGWCCGRAERATPGSCG